MQVTAHAAERVAWPVTYAAVGTVRARTATAISSRLMGYVREVRVDLGDRVRAGQLLVAIDARDLASAQSQTEAAAVEAGSALPEAESAVAAAQAGLELAEATFRRMNDLFQQRSISNQEFDEATAKLKLARAGYEMAVARRGQVMARVRQAEQSVASSRITRGFSQITAPFSGVVVEKNVEPGALATPGAPLLILEREGSYRLEASVEESHLRSIKPGQPVMVTLGTMAEPIAGRVSELVPAVDPGSRSFLAKIDLPGRLPLRSGIFGRAEFTLGEEQAVAVPASAVIERGALHSVFVIDGGKARSRLVTIGRRHGGRVEVLSGLAAGEMVATAPGAALHDGAAVEVRQ